MVTMAIVGLVVNLIAAVINSVVGIRYNFTVNSVMAMFNWLMTGYFLHVVTSGWAG